MTGALAPTVGLFLWRQSYTERIAVGTFARLIRSSLLTSEETRSAAAFMWEEMDHADCLRARAREYVRERPEQWPGFTPSRLPDHLALATTYIGERLMAPGFGLVIRAFQRFGDDETTRLYERIEIEEAPHIAWGHAVMRRLRADWQIAQDVRAFMRAREVMGAYKRVAPDQRWIREAATA